MGTVIRTQLVQIGNSRGVRIPRALLDQLHLTGSIEMEVQDAQLVLRAGKNPRAEWPAQFHEMAAPGNYPLTDAGLDGVELVLTDWEETEWEW
jgi:antitoxin MazE